MKTGSCGSETAGAGRSAEFVDSPDNPSLLRESTQRSNRVPRRALARITLRSWRRQATDALTPYEKSQVVLNPYQSAVLSMHKLGEYRRIKQYRDNVEHWVCLKASDLVP